MTRPRAPGRPAAQAVQDLPDGFRAAGFSNGGGMAEYAATQRPCSGVLMLSGALPVPMLGAKAWPAAVPAQIHHREHDPFRQQEWIAAVVKHVRAAGASIEVFDYPDSGHLFTDSSPPHEYDEHPHCCANARSPSPRAPGNDAGLHLSRKANVQRQRAVPCRTAPHYSVRCPCGC